MKQENKYGQIKHFEYIKKCISNGKKGKNIYQQAMDHAKSDEVKSFFKDLVDDEQEHMNILAKQFKAYMKNGKFVAVYSEYDDGAVSAPDILDQYLKDKINVASFEATAIASGHQF